MKIINDISNACVEIHLTREELEQLQTRRRVEYNGGNAKLSYTICVTETPTPDWRALAFRDGRMGEVPSLFGG